MTIGGVIAAADLAALQADSQMEPGVARDQAFLAAFDGGGELGDVNVFEVRASGHLLALSETV